MFILRHTYVEYAQQRRACHKTRWVGCSLPVALGQREERTRNGGIQGRLGEGGIGDGLCSLKDVQ